MSFMKTAFVVTVVVCTFRVCSAVGSAPVVAPSAASRCP